DIKCFGKWNEFIERNVLTSALNFGKVWPAQVRLFSQFFQGQTRVGSAGADVFPDDLAMIADMSHSTSKPEFGCVEHSTYRMFKLDPPFQMGIDPPERLDRPGGRVLHRMPPAA